LISDEAQNDDIDIPKEKVWTLARDLDFMNQLDIFCNGISNVFKNPDYLKIIAEDGAAALAPYFPDIPQMKEESENP